MVEPKIKHKESTSAPFNMALNTLERLGKILEEIKQVSVTPSDVLSGGDIQHIKFRLVKQFWIQSVPLMSKGQKEEIQKKFNEIKLNFVPKVINKHIADYVPSFSPKAEQELDEIIILVQEKLQDQKYFMPPKSDPKVAWRQS